MENKITASNISEAQSEINKIVKERFFKSTTVHSTMNFTVFFNENGEKTILNGNCHQMAKEPCIEFDIVYNHGYIDFKQNRFYNI